MTATILAEWDVVAAAMNYGTWGGAANYNSLQVTAKRFMSRTLTFELAYTFSKALRTADSIYNASAIPGLVRQANYSRLAYDRTHVLVVNYTYSFPKPIRGSNALLNTEASLSSLKPFGSIALFCAAPYH